MPEPKPAEVTGEEARAKHLPLTPEHLPALVPARMINEVLYCERLFYLEWVQGEFAHNEFTAEGKQIHTTSEQPRGTLPEAGGGEESTGTPFEVHSLWLSSERLGITAKIDVLKGDADGAVIPIEHKRGQAPDTVDGAWLPERAQLCAQALLLREHGYAVSEGSIWFAGSRKHVRIPIDEALVQATLEAVGRARELAARTKPPPPLSGELAKKCDGCSLVGICLPDEVRLLQDAGEIEARTRAEVDPPEIRRLMPARDDRRSVYVQDQGARVGIDGERLVIKGAEVKTEARLPNTSHVAVFGNVQVSTQAVRALLDRRIPLLYFSYGGWFVGRTIGLDGNNIELRVEQVRTADNADRCLHIARTFVAAKLRNARTLLRRNQDTPDPTLLGHLETLAKKAECAESIPSLLGLEGTGARAYFGGFAGMLGGANTQPFDLDGRNRRPPRDPVNALLSFAYTLLVKECVLALTVAGLDPMLGFYHTRRFGRPALALDMMEELRPILADSVVLGVINNGVVSPDDFVIHPTGVALKPHARKRVLLAHERRMDQAVTHPVFGYRVSYRRVLEVQARLLGRWVTGEIAEYPSFRTR